MMKAAGVLAASVALVLLGAALLAAPSRPNELLAEYGNGEYAQNQMNVANGQQLAEFQVAGSMQTGEPAPQGIPLSFQLPVPLPAPSPPAPTVITVGGSPNKGPECKRCERQMRKIKVRQGHDAYPTKRAWERLRAGPLGAIHACQRVC
jgi:hypothetical protein